jgi:hypothetical protein
MTQFSHRMKDQGIRLGAVAIIALSRASATGYGTSMAYMQPLAMVANLITSGMH